MSAASGSGFRAEVGDERVGLHATGFGADFRKDGDRWNETIRGAGPAVELARSLIVEGGDPRRVAHPVFQEVHLHGPAEGSSLCLLATGLSFDHHFSAAVTLSRDAGERPGIRLDFDVADRCRSPVESLAATYLVEMDSGALETADSGRIAWRFGTPDAGRLELVAGPGAALAMAEAGRMATRVQILASIRPGTFTHRLRYGWRWTSAEGLTR